MSENREIINSERQELCGNICKRFCENFYIKNYKCTRDVYLYNAGCEIFVHNDITMISVAYGICIKYVDCKNRKKSIQKEGRVMFCGVPDWFDIENFVVTIPNPPTVDKDCGCFKVCGKVNLCSPILLQ